jgi:hypothetical protein
MPKQLPTVDWREQPLAVDFQGYRFSLERDNAGKPDGSFRVIVDYSDAKPLKGYPLRMNENAREMLANISRALEHGGYDVGSVKKQGKTLSFSLNSDPLQDFDAAKGDFLNAYNQSMQVFLDSREKKASGLGR